MTIALALLLNVAAVAILLVLLTAAMRLPYRFRTSPHSTAVRAHAAAWRPTRRAGHLPRAAELTATDTA